MDYTEWIDGIFNYSQGDQLESDWSDELCDNVDNKIAKLSSDEMLRLITKTFNNAEQDLKDFSDQQVGLGLRLICDEAEDGLRRIYDTEVDNTVRLAAIKSIYVLYRDCFNVRCYPFSRNDGTKGNELDYLCEMFWDAGQLWIGGFKNDDARPVFIGAIANVLENALFLSNPACQFSALHGIGHSIPHLHADKKLLQKLEQAIDRYCRQPDVSQELRDYAKQARTGDIM